MKWFIVITIICILFALLGPQILKIQFVNGNDILRLLIVIPAFYGAIAIALIGYVVFCLAIWFVIALVGRFVTRHI
ncbi:MAG: hypothetical protein WC528_02950 [Patescibacteria group bacterium]